MNRKWLSLLIAAVCALAVLAVLPRITTSTAMPASGDAVQNAKKTTQNKADTAESRQLVLMILLATAVSSGLTLIASSLLLPSLVDRALSKRRQWASEREPAVIIRPPQAETSMSPAAIEEKLNHVQLVLDTLSRRFELLESHVHQPVEERRQPKPASFLSPPDKHSLTSLSPQPEAFDKRTGSNPASFTTHEKRTEFGTQTVPPAPPLAPPPYTPAPMPQKSYIEPALATYRHLLQNTALPTREFDKTLEKHGGLTEVVLTNTGRLAAVSYAGNPSRRLVGLHLPDGQLLLLPSSFFVKEFDMLFRESLEAGADIKEAFNTEVDGSGRLQYLDAATARIDASGNLINLRRGRLSGFVR